MTRLALLSGLLCASLQARAEPPATATGRRIDIEVNSDGYKPSTVTARPGEKLLLVFKRVESAGCANSVVVPAARFRAYLKLGEPVEVAVVMPKSGKLTWACPMDMYQGWIVPPAR